MEENQKKIEEQNRKMVKMIFNIWLSYSYVYVQLF